LEAAMYKLMVCHAGELTPTETIHIANASEVLQAIPFLLSKHTDCERVDVMFDGGRLFSVDCKGNRVG
jgi:hypothetical protein